MPGKRLRFGVSSRRQVPLLLSELTHACQLRGEVLQRTPCQWFSPARLDWRLRCCLGRKRMTRTSPQVHRVRICRWTRGFTCLVRLLDAQSPSFAGGAICVRSAPLRYRGQWWKSAKCREHALGILGNPPADCSHPLNQEV